MFLDSVFSWIGVFGGVLLAVCGFPLLFDVLKTKNTSALSKPFLFVWFFGEIFLCAYGVFFKLAPVVLNTVFNIVCLCIILFLVYKNERRSS